MKKLIWWVFLIIAITIGSVIGKEGGHVLTDLFFTNNTPDITSKEYLLKLASDINKTLPIMVDKETEMINVGAEEGELIYYYTMHNYPATELNNIYFLDEMKPILRKKVCTHSKMKVFWENGVSVSYSYKGNDNINVGKITITPTQCVQLNKDLT